MRCDSLSFSGLRNHEKLGKNSNGFKINGKCPKNFHWVKGMINKAGETSGGNNQKLGAHRIMVAVISSLKFHKHKIASRTSTRDIDNFHNCVIKRNKVHEKVEVSRYEADGKHGLSFSRNSSAAPRFPNLGQKNYNGHEMGHISQQPKRIHFQSEAVRQSKSDSKMG